MKTFVQGPEIYLKGLGIELGDFFDPTQAAVLDEGHRLIVNYETYFFADLSKKELFEHAIHENCGPLTDPITRQRFFPTKNSPHILYENRTFYFTSDSTLAVFQSMPEMYALPGFKMLPKKTDSLEAGV